MIASLPQTLHTLYDYVFCQRDAAKGDNTEERQQDVHGVFGHAR